MGENLILAAAHGIEPRCPMCNHPLAYEKSYGYLICTWGDCPRPTAAAELLSEGETEHIVTLRANGYSVKHPIRERLDDALLDCWLAEQVADYGQEWTTSLSPAATNTVELDRPYRMWIEGQGEDAWVNWAPAP